jgi:hypothetical protein
MSNRPGERDPTFDPPRLDEYFGRFYLPNLLGVFALSKQFQGRNPYGESYLREHEQINMPRIPLAVKKGKQIIPLEDDAVQIIEARTRHLIAIPHGNRRSFGQTELARFQALLDGTSIGMTELSISDRLGMGRDEFMLSSEWAREYLGATNQASVMYGARLHGYVPSIRPNSLRTPKLTLNRKLHLLLAAIGFDWNESAELTDSKPEAVKSIRSYVRKSLYAHTMPQAVSNGFEAGVFIALRDHDAQAEL